MKVIVDENGIGYRIPTNFAIHKNSIKPSMYARRQDWLTQLQKNKSLVPSPDKYEVSGKILNTPKLALNKSARYYFSNP